MTIYSMSRSREKNKRLNRPSRAARGVSDVMVSLPICLREGHCYLAAQEIVPFPVTV